MKDHRINKNINAMKFEGFCVELETKKLVSIENNKEKQKKIVSIENNE